MSYSEAIIQGLMLGLFISLSVGPTLFAVIKLSIQNSYKAGIVFVLGVSFSDILYVTIANIASKWLSFLANHEREVGYIGSALFIIMGLYGLIKKIKPKRPPRGGQIPAISTKDYLKTFASGFLMNTLNPGVIIFWMGSVTLISSKNVELTHRFLLFGVCLGLVLSVDFMKVFLAEKIRHKLTLRKVIYINRISSGIILMLGLFLMIRTFINFDVYLN